MRKIMNPVPLFAIILAILSMSEPAQAALSASGTPNPTIAGSAPPADGFPAFYQDSNGLIVQGCLDNPLPPPLGTTPPPCVLPTASEEDYNIGAPIVFSGGLPAIPAPLPGPTPGVNGGIVNVNFPSTFYYYYASTDPKGTALTAAGSTFTVLMTLEGTFQNTLATFPAASVGKPRPRAGDQIVFQRFQVDITNAPATGSYTLTHPWGSINFNCTAGSACQTIVKIPPSQFPGAFAVAPELGINVPGSIGPFMVPADAAGIPVHANVVNGHWFIGDPNTLVTAVTPNCPTCNANASGLSFVRIDGPAGAGISGTANVFSFSGREGGADVTPRNDTFPPTLVGSTSAAQTYTITNLDTAPLPLQARPVGAIALAGPNAGDYTMSETCSGVTLAAGSAGVAPGACTFTVAFGPKSLAPNETALRQVQVNITPFNRVQRQTSFSNLTINLSGTAQYPVTVSPAANGAITPAGTAGTLGVNAASAQVYTVKPNAKFMVRDITVDGVVQDIAKIRPTNPTQPVNFTAPATIAPQTVAATFMPSGNLTGSGTLDLSDAIKALRIIAGVQTPQGDDLVAMDVAPLGTDNRPNPDGTQDLKDVLLILRRVLGATSW